MKINQFYSSSKTVLFRFSLLAMLALVYLACKEEKKPDVSIQVIPPNIILIVADDQGWGDLSHHGNPNIKTPNIDALAKGGVSFQNFYVQAVCSPTRAEILTGLHYIKTGVYSTSEGGERIDPTIPTLANLLKNNGYRTAAFGKWHSGTQAPYHPNSRGFDEYYGFTSGHWGNYFSPMLEHNGKIVRGKGFLPDDLSNHAMAFIQEHSKYPFFVYLPYNTPHSPMQVPDSLWARVKNLELMSTVSNEIPDFTKAALALVENIDYNLGRLMQHINKMGLAENTIVIYLTDNGPNSWRFNAGMRDKKGGVNEGGVRSPLFIQWKNHLPEGKQIAQLSSAVDLLPTIASLAHLVVSNDFKLDGTDLSKHMVSKEEVPIQNRIIFNHWADKTSLRSQHFRLDEENRLYNLPQDRGQTNDVADTYPKVRDSLLQIKKLWLQEMRPYLKTKTEPKPFTVGHSSMKITQLPARDGIPHGKITRSNRWPNDSFFTHWTRKNDSISWDIDVMEAGNYQATVYYTCGKDNLGTMLQLRAQKSSVTKAITLANDPPLYGMEYDRVPRTESYVKDFKPLVLGSLSLQKGKQIAVLKAPNLQGGRSMDIRLLLLERMP